ncbi:hypothetical protein NP493_172g00025 [Ridgeia piscesae]|uniref:Uncharacterized protein n=1 Tax=Ridgeia piscesae TaxID=27915 RepID=A0AAD9P325_RIDPI|nr:hypothetical protein NP493_172g00025 [Ridgeia piscesae]
MRSAPLHGDSLCDYTTIPSDSFGSGVDRLSAMTEPATRAIIFSNANTYLVTLLSIRPKAVMKFSGLLLALVVLAVCGDIAHARGLYKRCRCGQTCHGLDMHPPQVHSSQVKCTAAGRHPSPGCLSQGSGNTFELAKLRRTKAIRQGDVTPRSPDNRYIAIVFLRVIVYTLYGNETRCSGTYHRGANISSLANEGQEGCERTNPALPGSCLYLRHHTTPVQTRLNEVAHYSVWLDESSKCTELLLVFPSLLEFLHVYWVKTAGRIVFKLDTRIPTGWGDSLGRPPTSETHKKRNKAGAIGNLHTTLTAAPFRLAGRQTKQVFQRQICRDEGQEMR